ncbi:hypothetical protein EUTSA_v10013894mg [Eutrema salsugineum]|uniref:F-box domain-containing protein n=1 Tax=Eutrema salsugineum TaxID=72664 RepID=V4LJL3_EUTSA|nr:putative F-box protein At4g17565 [Eutrema salsugineum]ESQ42627.1 hypothetical protein EUTSA_v10013894mg [Eutrema salsugineum]
MQNLKRRKLEEPAANWSNLCRDVIQMVLERLSATDFDRAKVVCSAWRSASRESVRKQNRAPWLILFPYERSYGYSCGMSNPTEKGLFFRSRSLGVEFTQSRCIATCGSWLLMYVRHRPKLYILNPLTRERIVLPPMESRKYDPEEEEDSRLWRLENTPSKRDLALTCEIRDLSSDTKQSCGLTREAKITWKGDDFWKLFPYATTWWKDLVYKDHRLYVFTQLLSIEIYDFSGDSLVEVAPRPCAYLLPPYLYDSSTTRIAVTPCGGLLLVRCYNNNSFYVYRMNHDTKLWDVMASLGDQALIFDLGITLPAKDVPGIKPDSIYFSGPGCGTKYISIFNLATRKVEPFVPSSTRKFFDARWFIPNV